MSSKFILLVGITTSKEYRFFSNNNRQALYRGCYSKWSYVTIYLKLSGGSLKNYQWILKSNLWVAKPFYEGRERSGELSYSKKNLKEKKLRVGMSRNFFLYYASLVLKKVENTGLESNRNSFNLIFLHKNCIILLEFFFSVIKVDNYFNCSKYNISEWIKWVFQLYVTIETYGLWEKGTIYLECTNYVFVTIRNFVYMKYLIL